MSRFVRSTCRGRTRVRKYLSRVQRGSPRGGCRSQWCGDKGLGLIFPPLYRSTWTLVFSPETVVTRLHCLRVTLDEHMDWNDEACLSQGNAIRRSR